MRSVSPKLTLEGSRRQQKGRGVKQNYLNQLSKGAEASIKITSKLGSSRSLKRQCASSKRQQGHEISITIEGSFLLNIPFGSPAYTLSLSMEQPAEFTFEMGTNDAKARR
jgi:hypothetical protein